MSVSNDNYITNLSYINKDFPALWKEILETVPKLTNKWLPSEANESDPLAVLLKMVAVFTDKANYSSDKNILELFPATLTQLRSAYNVYDMTGYVPDWYVSATTHVQLLYNGGTDTSSTLSDIVFNLDRFTMVSDENSEVVYTLLNPVTFTVGEMEKQSVLAIEGTINDLTVNGLTLITTENLDAQNRLYFTQTNIAQNGIFISSTGEFNDCAVDGTLDDNTNYWRRVSNLSQYLAGSRVYKFGVDAVTGSVYIQFPEDIGDLIGSGLYIKYILSSGESGNIKRGTLSKFFCDLNCSVTDGVTTENIASSNFTVSNELSTQNGSDPIDIEQMKLQFDKIKGVFDTLVTLRDYENYIYEFTNDSGESVVSNIRVSDRTNDLYTTFKKVSLLPNSGSSEIITEQVSGSSAMTAYDLRFYPTDAVSTIESYADYRKTFMVENEDTLKRNIEAAIKGSSCINHDYSNSLGHPIILTYDVTGQIYLNTVVSSVEAAEIKSAVELSLYKTFNARNIAFGEAIDYGTLIKTIVSADPRIQYAAVNPLNYILEESALNDFNERNEGLDITTRSILAGNTPWTTFSTFTYNFDEEMEGIIGVSASTPIIEIESKVEINKDQDAQGRDIQKIYKVGPSEDFILLYPKYNTETTYSSYLFYIAKCDSPDLATTVAADTPHKLVEGQYIYFFETIDTAKEFISGGSDSSCIGILKAGTIVQANHSIKFNSTIATDSYINMGSDKSISTVVRAEGDIRASNDINGEGVSKKYKVKICTNSQALIDTSKKGITAGQNKPTYTLLTGEYLFFTDQFEVELGIVSEGSTITFNSDLSGLDWQPVNEGTAGAMAEGNISGASSYFIEVGSGALSYALNEIYTLGEGYEVCILKDSAPQSGLLSNYKPNCLFSLPDDGMPAYRLNDSSWIKLPSLSTGDGYQGMIRLALTLYPGTSQILAYEDALGDFYGRKQAVNIACNNQNYEVCSSDSEQIGIQSSAVISSPGGIIIKLTESEQQLLDIYVFKKQTYYTNAQKSMEIVFDFGSSIFVKWPTSIYDSSGDLVETITLPGNENQCVIIPFVKSSNSTVFYLLCKGGSEVDLTTYGVEKVGQPVITTENAVYWSCEDQEFKSVMSLIGDQSSAIEMGENCLYVSGFNPTYIPSDKELIEQPLDPQSFFLTQHVCNRYVLPELHSTKDLVISSLSITR